MTDRAFEPTESDPFAGVFEAPPEKSGQPSIAGDDDEDNPFAKVMPRPIAEPVSTLGAFGRGAARGALPAIGSLPAIGAGAELGGAAGLAVGGPIGGLIGGAAGGIAGAIGGATAIDAAQSWALKQLPESWLDTLGMSDRQQKLDQEGAPVASFLGGLAPYAITMRPGFAATRALPKNSTALERIMSHPVTARVFGGGVMGGMELGQEAVGGEPTDWRKVAISTGFGVVFNRPTRIGEAITELGARPTRGALGIAPRPVSEAVPSEAVTSAPAPAEPEAAARSSTGIAPTLFDTTAPPTVADAADMAVMGPGISEQVFMGSHEPDPSATETARETKRTEQSIVGAPPAEDVHSVARQMHFDLFTTYDELRARRRALEGEPGAAAPLAATEAELARIEPEVQAAYRRAADAVGAETHEHRPEGPSTSLTDRSIEDQRDYIVQDAKRQLKAAGRPEEEARAVAQLVAARYETRAARMNGALGTAEELYDREAAEIGGQQIARKVTTPAAARALDDFQERMAAGKTAAQKRRDESGGAPQFGSSKERDREEARASTPQAVWDDLAAQRQEREKRLPIAKGYNDFRTRQGYAELRDKASQVWEPGNTVDVGFVKNLLIAEKNADGSFTLLAKPGKDGLSQSYNAKPHEGLVKEDRVNFLGKTRRIREPTPEEGWREAQEDALEGLEPEEHAQTRRELSLLTEEDLKWLDENALSGQNLFQTALGKINLNPKGVTARDFTGVEGVRPILTIMRQANASTAIHEFGHEWLGQMLRDAEHEKAPEGLKADRDAVLKWFGLDKAEDIATKHHEKFARGFEQYLRDGVAPSQRLAAVFAKFKAWLTRIYQSLKELGEPISADIRQVFDRMLVREPQRTVIAPDKESPRSLAEIHEADAAFYAAHEADPGADRIAEERNRSYVENPHAPELETNHAKRSDTAVEPPGETRPGGTGSREVHTLGGIDESEPGRESLGSQHEAERAGGVNPSQEGTGLRSAASRSGGREEPRAVPLAGTPAANFSVAGESFNVGRDGNVRAENITSVSQFVAAINESSERIGGGGPLTMGEMQAIVDDFALDPKTLSEAHLARMFGGVQNLSSKIWALRKAVQAQSETVYNAMREVRETGSDAATARFALEASRHDMMMSVLSSVTTETGRGLGMGFKNLEGWQKAADLNELLKANTGRTLFQLKQIAKLGASLDTPAKVSKYLRDAQKRSFGGMVLEYWINGLISGIATHVTYTQGNLILSLEKIGPETAAAAMIGAARKAMGREGETVRFGEVGAQFKGAIKGLPASLQAAVEGFRTGMTTLLPGEAARPLIPFAGDRTLTTARSIGNARVTWTEVGADMFGMVRGLRDGIVAGAELVKAGGEPGAPLLGFSYSPLGQIPDIALRGVPVLPVGSAIRVPGRFIAAIHSFFRTTNYSAYKAGGAYRAASNEGLRGTAFDARVGELNQNPSEAQMEAYRHEATEATLMGQGGKFAEALSRMTNVEFNVPVLGSVRFLKFIDPFVHISGNIINQAIVQRTPVGLLSAELRADLAGKNGNIAQDTAMARMLAGTALAVTFGGLAAEGYVSGSGPSDPRQSAMWRLAGNQPHSVRVGDIWYAVNKLGPIGMLLSIAADLHDVAHEAEKGELLTAASHLQHALTQNILDESFMRGPADLIKAVEDPGRYGEAYIRTFLSSFVPYSVFMQQMARASDPYSRQARTVVDAMKNKVPGLSETLLPRRDIWGEEMPNAEALGMKGLTAIYERKVSTDPVNLAMLNLGIAPAQVERKIRNIELTDQQYDDFARIAGRMTKMRLDTIVRSPDWQLWPNHIRHDVISEVIRQSRESSRGMMMMKYPQIAHDAVEARRQKFTAEPKGIE